MKILALDIGDQWTGAALSDPLGILAKPYKTVATRDIITFLQQTIATENVVTIIIGNPITLRGTESEQTKKVHRIKDDLAEKFPEITWTLWDERLSSKRSASLKKAVTKEEKLRSHAIAAAFILENYLQYRHQTQESFGIADE